MSGMDGLDALPDLLLHEILSHLPTKDAVRAQLISKRWRNLWAYLPVLDFDFADFWSEGIFSRNRHSTFVSEHSECHENFVRFVDAVLESRQIQQIEKFKLVWQYQVKRYNYHQHPVRKWILLVLQRNPRVLSIFVQPSISDVLVPEMVFACLTLEELRLQVDSRWPEIEVLEAALVNLPRLRKLNIGYYTIKGDFMDTVLLGCPNLEELELYACRLNLSHISSNGLKNLVLNGSCNSMDIRVSIPSLQYLKVTVMSCQTAGIIFENMSSLTKACVCFLSAHDLKRSFYNNEAKVLHGLSGVTNLEVLLQGSEAEGMLKHALTDCPDFENLKAVYFESFDGCLTGCMDMIGRLVQHSATLEHLSFYCCKDGSGEIKLLKQLTAVVREPGTCQLIERNQGHIYDSLDKLMKELNNYMMRFAKMETEVEAEEGAEEEDDGDDDDGGEALWEDGEWEEDDDADLAEE